ncbi:MAG: NUDIX domain-containing protein [Defluviitaleaceae bacterium]|nr:NUDIX domain-containing protein [Defluviitaleaceae bacterium]
MIKLQSYSTAFLKNNGHVLLIKRSPNKKVAPGVWSGVGGGMESYEFDNPCEACYREIEEESGIQRSDIQSLSLLYVIVRRWQKHEIRQNYVYFGDTSKTTLAQTDEGTLHWVPEEEWLNASESKLFNREYTQTFAAMLKHYAARDPQDKAVYVGVAGNNNGKLTMTWTRCEDFE